MDKKAAIELTKKYLSFLISKKYPIKSAYLFGSYAQEKFDEDSDIDLAIIMKDLENDYEMQVELMILGSRFDSRIEPHPIDETDFIHSYPFADEILETGIKIL